MEEKKTINKKGEITGKKLLGFLLLIVLACILLPFLVVLVLGLGVCAILPACVWQISSFLKERSYNKCKLEAKLKTDSNYCKLEALKIKNRHEGNGK